MCKLKNMINIDLKLFVTLSAFHPCPEKPYGIKQGTTVGQLVKSLDIPGDMVKLIFINGIRKGLEYELKDGDRVGLFPPVGGG